MENSAQARATVRHWAERHSRVALYDDDESMLLDVASGKTVKLHWADVAAFEEKSHPETGEAYIVLLFENGKQIALADPGGIAFPPSYDNAAPVAHLPAVVCLGDFLTLKQRIDHYLYQHPDEPVPRESLDLIMACIAILDGARAVGFDVADLEGQLESSLTEVERRKA